MPNTDKGLFRIKPPDSLHNSCRAIWVCNRCGNCVRHCKHDDPANFREDLDLPCSEGLAAQRDFNSDLWSALYDFRKHLFLGCPASDDAQERFQTEAYQNRGKLLLWPYERKGAI